jgi:hypothetical protein
MIQNVLKDVGGIGLYGIVSVCLFCVVFATALLWACAQKKNFLNKMSVLPLDEQDAKREENHE